MSSKFNRSRLLKRIAVSLTLMGIVPLMSIACSTPKKRVSKSVQDEIQVSAQAAVEEMSGTPSVEAPRVVTPSVPAEDAKIRFGPLLAASFDGEKESTLPTTAGSDVQRLAMARAEARRGALREMSKKILSYDAEGTGSTFSDVLRSRPDWGAAYTDALESKSEVELNETPERIHARTVISGAKLAVAMGIDKEVRAASTAAVVLDAPTETNAAPSSSGREEAKNKATDAARHLLWDTLMESSYKKGTYKTALQESPEKVEQLRTLINSLEPSDVNFTSDGRCEVQLVLDRTRAQQILDAP